jgi:hypothetical protein
MTQDLVKFPIYFDLPEHYLFLDEFTFLSEDIETILNEFNNQLFRGKLSFKVAVLPPEDGSFWQNLGVFIVTVTAGAWTALETDIGKDFVKGLTNHEPSYWS